MSDDYRDLDLRGFDLDKLDLDHIELDDDRPSPVWRWILGMFLATVTGVLIWLPRSNLYTALNIPWVSFTFSFAGIVVGLLSGRFLWTLLSEMQADAAPSQASAEPDGPPSAARRLFSLLVVVGGASAIVYFTQSGQVDESGTTWFFVAVGAVVVGITFGRWLTMQAQVVDPLAEEVEPITLPPWFKWVTLAVLIVGGAGIGFGSSLFPANEDLSLALSAGGFALGIVAAIWLARRFEEEEERLRNRRER